MRDQFSRFTILGAGLVLALFVLATSLRAESTPPGQRNQACGAPSSIDDGWEIASPGSVGMDGAQLCTIAARLEQQATAVHSVVVIRHGKLVFEQYFPGYDQPWGQTDGQYEFTATTKHDMRSVTKSVTSLLVGIAIDRKLVAGVDAPVLKFFPDTAAVKQPGWDAITLRHLLTMSSGIKWDEALAWTDPKNDGPHLVSASGTANKLSRPTGSHNRSRRASRRLAISAAHCSTAINGGWAARWPAARTSNGLVRSAGVGTYLHRARA